MKPKPDSLLILRFVGDLYDLGKALGRHELQLGAFALAKEEPSPPRDNRMD
jgi:hypothetical protein